MLWEVDVHPAAGQPDHLAKTAAAEAADLGLAASLSIDACRGFLIQGAHIGRDDVQQVTDGLLLDPVVEEARLGMPGQEHLNAGRRPGHRLVQVLPKPGVMDPVAQSTHRALTDFGLEVEAVRTLRKYWVASEDELLLKSLAERVLANDAIEEVVFGPLQVAQLELGSRYELDLRHVPIRELGEEQLNRLSREQQLYLQPAEMLQIQRHYRDLGREPTDIELETLAQTWSEHCSHKTLAGRIAYRDERGSQQFENMLKETIFAATHEIRRRLGADDWCVSVFEDNAGVVRFDGEHNLVFKVETHNHPSAIEPYGGANTGIGGVIRDPLGTGLGAKPICNTDVFCFAPPDVPLDDLPPGVLHPRRVIRGVVGGVRDYGNRMGIPTVNGAVYFDRRYLGNPLVYCGNVGLIPRDKSFGRPEPNDLIVVIGGRTGRDGIHGATFSSVELTSQSEAVSGGAVQIGNAITEKMVVDVVLAARDHGLYNAITDCGAGGFSSAVGEMGEDIGADVWLERAPLKYAGLSYTEIWISEAQERMVLSVPEERWERLEELCAAEGVEATIIGRFVPGRELILRYNEVEVGRLSMEFLHGGRPPVVRQAVYNPPPVAHVKLPAEQSDFTQTLLSILGSLNVASKHWIIRQYDHEVQGGSVIKPLVGKQSDGPSDAAVVRPVLSSRRGAVIGCGMNPRYGDLDTCWMAASAIDEAMRNCVAVGADPARIALLDNFCWGDCEKPETLGSLVRAALACRDSALLLRTPFISGKDSLNNEFSYVDSDGQRQTIAIPPSLLISALGQVADVRRCVTMDLKREGSHLYLVGRTLNELGGSHFNLVEQLEGGRVPQVDGEQARRTFAAIHRAIDAGTVLACHDLSEGGLAVAAAEMAFAGGFGPRIDLSLVPRDDDSDHPAVLLFSESNTRFLCEVPPDSVERFESLLGPDVPFARIGEVEASWMFVVHSAGQVLIEAELADLRHAWRSPLDW